MGWRKGIVATGFLVISGVAGAAAGQVPASFDLRVVAQRELPELEAGSTLSVPMVLANDGTTSWSSADGFALAYHWYDEDGEIVVWDGRRTTFPEPVLAGGEVSITAVIEAPKQPGRYLLEWDVVREGVLWVSDRDPSPVKKVVATVVSSHAFAVEHGMPPRMMVAGGEATVRVRVRNEGSRTWLTGGSFGFSYHWLNRGGTAVVWEGRRAPMPDRVAPGETVDLTLRVLAPRASNVWRLQWDMVEDGVCWFSDRAPQPVPAFTVVVVPDVFASLAWWCAGCLLAAAVAVSAPTRGFSRFPRGALAVADVMWCAGSLVVKQGWVLATAAVSASTTGRALMVGSAAAIALVLLLLPGKIRPWSCLLVAVVGSFLLWGDTIYLRFFGDLPGPGALAGVGQLGRVEASVRSLMEAGDLWMWADILPGIVLVMSAHGWRKNVGPRVGRVAAAVLVTMMVIGAAGAWQLVVRQPGLLHQVFRRTLVAREVGVLNLHAVNLVDRVVRSVSRRELAGDRFDEVVRWFEDRAPYRAGAGPWFGAAAGDNLIMIQVESLQGFVIGLEIGGTEVTPFLNRWAKEVLWFSNVTDQTAQGRSSDSELTTQVSLLPASGGAAAFRFSGNDFTGLAEVLAGRGYATLSAVPYDGSFWNRQSIHPAYGYAESLFVGDFAAGENVGWGLSDRDFLEQIGERLAGVERPFAASLLTLSLHHPFDGFPEQLKVLDVGRWEGSPFGNFLHTMHFFDASLAGFIAGLEESGLADSTVVAVWGDHDAGFPWRPEIAAAMGSSHDPEGWYLSQEVPLLIRVPGAEALQGEILTAAGHVDVAPTLLALLGVDPSPYAFLGRNLLGAPGDPPVVGEYGCWRDGGRLFLQGDGSLSGGVCLEIPTMARLPATDCAEGYAAAAEMVDISGTVLEHDLQGRIHGVLQSRGVGRE